MSVAYRADDQPPSARVEYWHHVVGSTLSPLELRLPAGLDSRDWLRVGEAGAVRVAQLSVGESSGAARTRAHIRSSDPELYKVDVHARGRGLVEQGGREAPQAPGDLTLIDLSRPSHWAYSSAEVVAVVFPRALLPLGADELARLTGVRIPGDRGAGALVSSMARQLPARLGEVGEAERARLGTSVLDLLSVALAARLDRGQAVPAETRQRALVLRIQAFIVERLGDPELSPRSIAAAQYISVRYLHKLFEPQETTVADWIRRRRLERCSRDLLDPALGAVPVGAIGARWGLTSAAHFSRLFRARFGVPPVDYRRLYSRFQPK